MLRTDTFLHQQLLASKHPVCVMCISEAGHAEAGVALFTPAYYAKTRSVYHQGVLSFSWCIYHLNSSKALEPYSDSYSYSWKSFFLNQFVVKMILYNIMELWNYRTVKSWSYHGSTNMLLGPLRYLNDLDLEIDKRILAEGYELWKSGLWKDLPVDTALSRWEHAGSVIYHDKWALSHKIRF